MKVLVRRSPTQYLSKENTGCLRGLMAVIIVVHHLTPITQIVPGAVQLFLKVIGFLATAVFFFLSGYGMALSVDKGGASYVDSFPRNRILPYYCICVFLVIISVLVNFFTQSDEITMGLMVQSLTFGADTIVSKGWYLQTALLCYLGFYLIYKFCPSSKSRLIWAVVAVATYIIGCILLHFPENYYKTVSLVIVGGLWYHCEEKLDDVLLTWKSMLPIVLMSGLCCVGGLFLPGLWAVYAKMVLAILFVVIVIYLTKFISICCGVTRILGRYSFEIYVFHGMFIRIFRCDRLYIANDWVFVGLVLAGTALAGILTEPLFRKIYALARRK